MGTLDRYIAGNFLKALTAVLVILLALFAFMVLAEELESVGQGSFTTRDALRITALSMPRLILDLLPTVALLGTVIGLGGMAGNREIIVLRAVGWSPWRVGRPVLLLVGAGALLMIATQQMVVAPLERVAGDLRAKALAESMVSATRGEFWTRSGNHIVRVGDALYGVAPQDIEIYEINPAGNVARVTRAAYADILADNLWLLHGVRESSIEAEAVVDRQLDSLQWQSFLSPRQMAAFVAPAETLSVTDLRRYIRQLRASGLSTLRYELIYWQQIAGPIGLLAMTLIGLPFVMGSVRRFTASYRITLGAAIGIAFYLLKQITGHVALIWTLPPAPAALGPTLVLLLVALIVLRRMSAPAAQLPAARTAPLPA